MKLISLTSYRSGLLFTRSALAMRGYYPSSCLCVCLCVRVPHAGIVSKYRITQTTMPKVVGRRNFPKICAQSDPPPFQKPQFRPIFAHRASTVRAGEKVQLALIGSRPSAFQRVTDEPCTGDLRFLPVKLTFVCYKASFCENFQRQGCSYIIPLSSGP